MWVEKHFKTAYGFKMIELYVNGYVWVLVEDAEKFANDILAAVAASRLTPDAPDAAQDDDDLTTEEEHE